MFEPGQSKAEALAAHVDRLVRERRLRSGEWIATKAELREQTGLAAATISEGIRLLQARGQVTVRPGPGGGLFVASVSPLVRLGHTLVSVQGEAVDLLDALTVREGLEPLVAVDAARHRSAADIVELRALVARMAEALHDPEGFLRANWRLHERIARISANVVLRTLYLGLAGFLEEQALAIAAGVDEEEHALHKEQRLRLHQDLVEAIAAADVEEAERVGRRHAVHLSVADRAADRAIDQVPSAT
ncbi:FadR family transcriptional regulator [Modestobacter lapidis]|nr:FadR family transcriptional regulator [Modestobacter lapidis]